MHFDLAVEAFKWWSSKLGIELAGASSQGARRPPFLIQKSPGGGFIG
jgi:hypothetical protein